MTQQPRLCLLKMLFFLLFEPIVCPPNEHFDARQNRSSYIDTTQYYTTNFGEVKATNTRNFEYQQHRPQYQSRQDSQSQETQQFSMHVQELTSPVARTPLPYQSINNPNKKNMELNDKIRSIFHVGSVKSTYSFNSTIASNFSSSERMHSDDSFKNTDDVESMTLSSLRSSSSPLFLTTSTQVPTLLTAMSDSEPTFKVQRTADGKLSLVFNDSSLQQSAPQYTNQSSVVKRPDIIYPDQTPADTSFSGCESYEGQSLCKKVRNYPKLLHLDRILKQEFTQLGLYFAEDLELPLNVKQRFGGDPDEIDLCDSEERIIYPEAGMTKDLRWMLIVNDNTTYKQGVRIEECIGKDRPCNIIHNSLPNLYTSVCRQHYNYRQLVAITNSGKVVKDHFKIPSCCKCMLRNVSPF